MLPLIFTVQKTASVSGIVRGAFKTVVWCHTAQHRHSEVAAIDAHAHQLLVLELGTAC